LCCPGRPSGPNGRQPRDNDGFGALSGRIPAGGAGGRGVAFGDRCSRMRRRAHIRRTEKRSLRRCIFRPSAQTGACPAQSSDRQRGGRRRRHSKATATPARRRRLSRRRRFSRCDGDFRAATGTLTATNPATAVGAAGSTSALGWSRGPSRESGRWRSRRCWRRCAAGGRRCRRRPRSPAGWAEVLRRGGPESWPRSS
jgi:hypothetical protein